MSNREDRPELQRDATLERAWRAASTEQPSARLDAAILAAAHEAVASPHAATSSTTGRVPARSRWNRWAPMAAAAAVAGLAFTLVQTLPRGPARTPKPAAQESAAPTLRESATPAAPEAAPTPAVSAVPQSLPLEAIEERSSFEDRGGLGAARSKAADAALTEGGVNVDEWVQRIVALHAAGDVAAAAEQLRAFRAAEPGADRHLPESLREWAGSVR